MDDEPREEFRHIAWLRRRVPADPRVPLGPGDDCAAFSAGPTTLVTTDMLLEGVHFTLGAPPEAIGRKAMNVNLSDLAAMAALPTAAVVAVGLPGGLPEDFPRRLFEGMLAAAAKFNVAVVGGDTNRSPGGLAICVTAFGQPTAKGYVTRAGARPGDILCVTGQLGRSLPTGHHLDFKPRVAEALALHADYRLAAMLDLSDGLAGDLPHLCEESGVGAVVDAAALPLREGPDDGIPGWRHALDDGEDFELLFALPPAAAAKLLAAQPLAVPVARIGQVTADRRLRLRLGGAEIPFPRGGYGHRWHDGP